MDVRGWVGAEPGFVEELPLFKAERFRGSSAGRGDTTGDNIDCRLGLVLRIGEGGIVASMLGVDDCAVSPPRPLPACAAAACRALCELARTGRPLGLTEAAENVPTDGMGGSGGISGRDH